MEYIIVSAFALIASLLTFFSGFGLSTMLTPVFILFFPIDLAIAMTAIVHFLNNLFKIGLVGKNIAWKVALKFGIPAILGAFIGANLLMAIDTPDPLFTYELMGITAEIQLMKLIIAIVMACFAILELIPAFNALQFDEDKLVYGGILSGFFGGLSGHQGALRSLFLIKCGLSKQAFIATGVAIATFIDVTRLSIYFTKIDGSGLDQHYSILGTAVIAAFTGALLGKRLLQKVTLQFVQVTVSVLIIIMSVLLGGGIL